MKSEILYEPYYLVKNVNVAIRSCLPKNHKNGKYKYKLLNYSKSIKISEETGQLYFSKNLEIKDYVIKILREYVGNPDKNVNTSFIVFVRGEDEVDLNNNIIEKHDENDKIKEKKNVKKNADKKADKKVDKKVDKKSNIQIGIIEKIIRSFFIN